MIIYIIFFIIWCIIGFFGQLYWWNKTWGEIDSQGIATSVIASPLGVGAFLIGWLLHQIYGSKF